MWIELIFKNSNAFKFDISEPFISTFDSSFKVRKKEFLLSCKMKYRSNDQNIKETETY